MIKDFITKLKCRINGIKLEELPDYGDHMTIEAFKKSIECGAFIDYDGFGDFATKTMVSDKTFLPSNFLERLSKYPWATHVVWYNK